MFSVIIDNYNYGRYIGAAIESVLSQTYEDFELIIVDDGSTDDSREVIDTYSDPRIITVFKENGGQASAFNAGFERASRDYVAFLNADDLWHPKKIERCAEILHTLPGIVLLNHAYSEINAEGKDLEKVVNIGHEGTYDLLADLRRLKTDLRMVPGGFVVGRRKECLELCINEEAWRIAADTPLIVGLGLRGPIFNLDESLGSYRLHGANDSHGKFTDDLLYFFHQRFFGAVNDELKRMGSDEYFDFSKSDFAINHAILKNNRFEKIDDLKKRLD